MKLLWFLLYPFAIIYDAVTTIHNTALNLNFSQKYCQVWFLLIFKGVFLI